MQKVHDIFLQFNESLIKWLWINLKVKDYASLDGSGGGTCLRAMIFCRGRPGWNPGSDFGFFSVQNCCHSFLTECRASPCNV